MSPSEIHIRRRAPLFFPALLFAGGCWMGTIPMEVSEICREILYFTGASCLTGFLVLWWKGPHRARSISFISAFLLAGLYYGWEQQLWLRADDVRLVAPRLADQRVTWRGKVDSLPDGRPTAVQIYLKLTSAKTDDHSEIVSGRILIRLRRPPPSWQLTYGQTIEVPGSLQQPMIARNPGQLDYRRYLYDHGVYYTLSADYAEVRLLDRGPRWNLFGLAARAREWAGRKLTLGLTDDPTVSAILAGMLFGNVEAIPTEIDNAFRITGTYHIFAVSGQNLAELLGLGILCLQTLGFVRWRWGWTLTPALIFFCLISDNQPSIIRALIMGLFCLLAWRLGRPLSSLNLWSVTLGIIMISDPRSLRDLGFLLSFAVVLALMLLAGPIVRWLQGPWELDPFIPRRLAPRFLLWREEIGKGASALVGTSLAAWVGSVPLMWICFHQVSVISIIANLFVVPLAGLIVIVGTLSILLATFSTTLTLLLNNANWLAVHAMLIGVLALAHWPGASSYVSDPATWGSLREPHLTIGQSGSNQIVLLRYRGQNWLINTGSENDYRFLVNPMRKFYGINHWDGVILSELSVGAMGGASLLAAESPVLQWWIPHEIPHLSKIQKILQPLKAKPISRGFIYRFDSDLTLSVLSPWEENDHAKVADEELVLLLQYKSRRLLYAGSIGFGVEQEIVRRGGLSPIEVLVQGHHPEEPNLSPSWLSSLHPLEIVQGAKTTYQKERLTEDNLESTGRGSPLIWDQANTGAMEIILREKGVEAKPFLTQTSKKD